MTNAEIRAELIRSAKKDYDPYEQCSFAAWKKAREYSAPALADMDTDMLRTFYLLVAEELK